MLWFITGANVLAKLNAINQKLDTLMSQQDEVNAAAAQIQADVAAMNTALDAIKLEIANLQGANPSLDLTGLQSAVAQLDAATASEQDVANPPA